MRKIALIAALVATLVVALAAPVAAAKPGGTSSVTIANVVDLVELPSGHLMAVDLGAFKVKGAAPKKGLVCAGGVSWLVDTTEIHSWDPLVYTDVRWFDCGGGDGFTIKYTVTTKDFTKASPGTMVWSVLRGNGAYESLTGGGTGKVDPERKNQVVESFSGKISLP